MLFEAWQREKNPSSQVPAGALPTSSSVKQSVAPTPANSLDVLAIGPSIAPAALRPIVVRTDLFKAEIDPVGATIRRFELLKQQEAGNTQKNIVLLRQDAERTYLAHSGLLGIDGAPNHKTVFIPEQAESGEVVLRNGSAELVFRAQGPQGIEVRKILHFKKATYAIEERVEVRNVSSQPLELSAYYRILRDDYSSDRNTPFMSTFTGAAVFTEAEKFQKLAFTDIAEGKASRSKNNADGWVAMVEHYFLSAWVAEKGTKREFFSRQEGERLYSVGMVLPLGSLAPGEKTVSKAVLYAGPQEQDKLKQIAPGLELVVDYGWLTIIAAPLFWLLQWLHQWAQNWGVAIILLTVIVKAVFFPLSAASYRSMAKMRVVTPKLMQLRETYGNDRVRMNQEMMELYKREKINPLGGCLPILIQIPVFIALYWVLLASVEMRNAPFLLDYGFVVERSILHLAHRHDD